MLYLYRAVAFASLYPRSRDPSPPRATPPIVAPPRGARAAERRLHAMCALCRRARASPSREVPVARPGAASPVVSASAVTPKKMPRSLSYVRGPTSVGAEGVVVLVFWASLCARGLSLASLIDRGIPCRRRGVSSAKEPATVGLGRAALRRARRPNARRHARGHRGRGRIPRENEARAVDGGGGRRGSALTQRCAILLCAALARLARFRSLEVHSLPLGLQDEFAESTIPHVYAVSRDG